MESLDACSRLKIFLDRRCCYDADDIKEDQWRHQFNNDCNTNFSTFSDSNKGILRFCFGQLQECESVYEWIFVPFVASNICYIGPEIPAETRLKGYLGNWPHYYRVVRSKLVYNVLTTSINNTHIKLEKFENNLQFRNNFLANLRKRTQFSKHSVSFMRFSGPYVIVTQSSESA
jgi:hypothetical protein